MQILQPAEAPSRSRRNGSGAAPTARLRLGGMPVAAAIGAALFPDFVIEQGHPAASDLPFATLGEGLLRAPPDAGHAAAGLSAVALSVSGPRSPADRLDPARILAARGWETPALIDRARAGRRALLATRLGGMWWENELPAGESVALVAVAQPGA